MTMFIISCMKVLIFLNISVLVISIFDAFILLN